MQPAHSMITKRVFILRISSTTTLSLQWRWYQLLNTKQTNWADHHSWLLFKLEFRILQNCHVLSHVALSHDQRRSVYTCWYKYFECKPIRVEYSSLSLFLFEHDCIFQPPILRQNTGEIAMERYKREKQLRRGEKTCWGERIREKLKIVKREI